MFRPPLTHFMTKKTDEIFGQPSRKPCCFMTINKLLSFKSKRKARFLLEETKRSDQAEFLWLNRPRNMKD